MAKYLIKASYSKEGIKGLVAGGASSRRAAIDSMISSVGGTVESLHFAFGETDAFVIADLPSDAVAVAVAAAVGGSDAISSYETVRLIDPADIDAAAKITVEYRPPGS